MARNRMAGDKITEAKRNEPRDWSIPNWDNPTKKEQRKFEKATGYPQYLGGFREKWRDDYMKDGVIDYYSDNKLWDRIHKKVGKKTGLTMNKVDDIRDAEIVNVWNDVTQEEHTLPRHVENFTFKGYKREHAEHPQAKDNPNALIGGISYPVDGKDYNPNNDDMFQYNSVNTEDRVSKEFRKKSAWHEIGHSLGLAGDNTLTDKDPSVMSYNHDFNNKTLGTREFESIKKLHAGYGEPVTNTRSKAKSKGQSRLIDRKASQ